MKTMKMLARDITLLVVAGLFTIISSIIVLQRRSRGSKLKILAVTVALLLFVVLLVEYSS